MKFYYNEKTFNLLERQYEGKEPFSTEIAPDFNINYNQFAKFDIEKQKWIILDKKQDGFYCNLNNLSIIQVSQFDDVDLTDYVYNYIKNEGDDVNFIDNKIEYITASQKTLDFFKNRKFAELKLSYEKAQVARIINGITFFTPLMGEFYNTTAQVRKSKAEIREDNLMYIRVPAIDGKEYVSRLPVAFYNMIDKKLDVISIENNEIKARYIININYLAKVNEIILLQFNFPAIQDININDLADIFIADANNKQEDRDYLASLNKKFFTEFK